MGGISFEHQMADNQYMRNGTGYYRYNYTKNTLWNAPNATSMDGGTRMSGGRTSQYSMSFANSMYSMDNLVHSFTLDLNSRLTDNLSNQFLATYSKLDDVRGTNSSEFPFIDITRDDNNYMALGYELFTWNNAVHNTIWNIKDDLTYYLGNHKIMGGISFATTRSWVVSPSSTRWPTTSTCVTVRVTIATTGKKA